MKTSRMRLVPMVNLDIRLMRKRLAPAEDVGPVTPPVTGIRCESAIILIYGGMSVKADIRSGLAGAVNFYCFLPFAILEIRRFRPMCGYLTSTIRNRQAKQQLF